MPELIVVGGGVAGLVAARAAAQRGVSVAVIEGSEQLGGQVSAGLLGGVPIDLGAESFATRGDDLLHLVADLSLPRIVPHPQGAWVALADRIVPLPKAGVLGIPAFPLSDEVRAAVGWSGAVRAWLDRLLPQLTVGRERNLGALVNRRMGRKVLDSLVTPVVSRVYALHPRDVDVDSIAPALNAALTVTGSLSQAVVTLRAAQPAGSAVAGLAGGISTLVDALVADLRSRGVTITVGERVLSLTPDPSSRESLREEESDPAAGRAAPEPHPRWLVETASRRLAASRVLLATDGGATRELLAPLLPTAAAPGWPPPRTSTVIVLRVRGPGLAAAPRGSGVLVADASDAAAAKSLTHLTAKWPGLRDRFDGDEVLRLAYDGPAGADADLVAQALRDAAALLDVPTPTVVAFVRRTWRLDPPPALRGQRQRIRDLEDAIRQLPGLAATGAWIAGTGLSAVVAHASAVGTHPA